MSPWARRRCDTNPRAFTVRPQCGQVRSGDDLVLMPHNLVLSDGGVKNWVSATSSGLPPASPLEAPSLLEPEEAVLGRCGLRGPREV